MKKVSVTKYLEGRIEVLDDCGKRFFEKAMKETDDHKISIELGKSNDFKTRRNELRVMLAGIKSGLINEF